MSFYSPKRTNAQLIWFYRGFVEYLFPNNIRNKGKITSIEFSLEICSEAPNYRIDWPSDITVWINDIEIDTWTCPGDFGGRQGIYTPKWWSLNATQFGVLKRWQINDHGTFFDFKKVSKITLKDLNLNANDAIKFRIGVKKDAKNIGGINIFGYKFGDYQQNIVLRIDYLE
jgi:predicted transcriptional regulator